jgi:hypothetical protein
MSKQERVSWVSLVVTVFLATWYFGRVFALPGDADLHSRAMIRLVSGLIIYAILLGIAGEVVLNWVSRKSGGADADRVALDERDALINLKAGRNAYIALFIGICTVLWQIAATESQAYGYTRPTQLVASVGERILVGPLTPLLIAQGLLLVLTVAGISVYLTRIVYYRRGF